MSFTVDIKKLFSYLKIFSYPNLYKLLKDKKIIYILKPILLNEIIRLLNLYKSNDIKKRLLQVIVKKFPNKHEAFKCYKNRVRNLIIRGNI